MEEVDADLVESLVFVAAELVVAVADGYLSTMMSCLTYFRLLLLHYG